LSPVTEVRLLVQRELVRSVRSVKGIVLGVITLIGAVIASFAVVLMEGSDRAKAGSEQALVEMRRQLLEKQTGDAPLAAYLASMPESLRSFLAITIWLGPLLIALLGFDTVAGELQHKSVRFWTVRSRRGSYFTGKLVGLWVLVGLITLVLSVMVDAFALVRGYVGLGDIAGWGTRFFFVAFVIAGPWAAIATFISSCFKQPIGALLTTFATFFLTWIASLVGIAMHARELIETGKMGDMHWYEYLYPNAYDNLLLSPQPAKVFTALGILLGFVVVAAAGGSFLFAKRDI
jgi:ABC-type transport system involved in multi-copper enzyme maturation permease subunit